MPGHGPIVGYCGPFTDYDHVRATGPDFFPVPWGLLWFGLSAGTTRALGVAASGIARTGFWHDRTSR